MSSWSDIDDVQLAYNIIKGHNSRTVKVLTQIHTWSEFCVYEHCVLVLRKTKLHFMRAFYSWLCSMCMLIVEGNTVTYSCKVIWSLLISCFTCNHSTYSFFHKIHAWHVSEWKTNFRICAINKGQEWHQLLPPPRPGHNNNNAILQAILANNYIATHLQRWTSLFTFEVAKLIYNKTTPNNF